MFTEKLKQLPPWESFRLPKTAEGEEWKWKEQLDAAKALYNQWREIFQLVQAFLDTLPETKEEELPDTRHFILQNAYVVAPKIHSAAGDMLYEIKMENAAIIRFNCRQMMEQVGYAAFTGEADMAHKEAIEEAMVEFKRLFRHWVSLFKKDEYEDEWGLYI